MDDAHSDPRLAGLAAGDERAFADLYDQYAARLYRAALGMLGRREDAEDVVQEVFAAVFNSRHRLGEVQNVTAYLFTALRRAAGRAAARRVREPPAGEAAMAEVIDKTQPDKSQRLDDERLEQALRTLSAEQREVIALKIDGGLTFAETAEVLGISANTAASRYRYALESLRATLRQDRSDVASGTPAVTESKPPGTIGRKG